MNDFKRYFQEAVVEALSRDDGYRIVDAPGPDVLRITAELIDLIVRIPTQRTAVRGSTFTRSYGEVTLVLEARDSQSGEILARAAERRDPTTGDMVEVQRTSVIADVRRLFQYWAGIVRERLDELRAVEIEAIQ